MPLRHAVFQYRGGYAPVGEPFGRMETLAVDACYPICATGEDDDHLAVGAVGKIEFEAREIADESQVPLVVQGFLPPDAVALYGTARDAAGGILPFRVEEYDGVRSESCPRRIREQRPVLGAEPVGQQQEGRRGEKCPCLHYVIIANTNIGKKILFLKAFENFRERARKTEKYAYICAPLKTDIPWI